MTLLSATRRSLLAAATAGTLTLGASAVMAQQAAAPLPPGSPMIGRPDTEEARKLAPVAPLPIPTAAEKLPLDKLVAPKGFKIEVFAANVANAREMREGDKGTVFVGSRLIDKVHAIVTKDGKRDV
ncbi:MAG TPA: sorbosone dehydrogenase family protein, partial [Xanthobacteraceae bacterium]|nr:sorbosone dehydrogenase family protein [Xanthobacteraceae bacterium]